MENFARQDSEQDKENLKELQRKSNEIAADAAHKIELAEIEKSLITDKDVEESFKKLEEEEDDEDMEKAA